MHFLEAENIYTDGPLMKRAIMSCTRLESNIYTMPDLFKYADENWPGDWEGRALLGQICLYKYTHRSPRHLKAALDELPKHLNKDGYFGKIAGDHSVNEQQMAGNSWFLRAMCEYYEWTNDPTALQTIKNITYNLLIPSEEFYRSYPLNRRAEQGKAMGKLLHTPKDGWYLSTDTGCAFIMLDGAAHAYKILKDQVLGETLKVMIEKLSTADYVGLEFQTHAILSATRGILRYYEVAKDSSSLAFAEKIFDTYLQSAITENYANYNWFRKPEWTEPCAYIDSYIVAMELFRFTKKVRYLETAHKIYYNAIGFGQRANGGFGVDVCSGVKDAFLRGKSDDLYEAYWCCSMRGGEGLSKAILYQYLVGEDNSLYVSGYNSNTIQFRTNHGCLMMRQSTRYPEEGYSLFEILKADTEKVCLHFFIPSYVNLDTLKILIQGKEVLQKPVVQNGFLELEINPNITKKIEIYFDIPLICEETAKDHLAGKKYSHGFVLLGALNASIPLNTVKNLTSVGLAMYQTEKSELLVPVYQILNFPKDQFLKSHMQIVF